MAPDRGEEAAQEAPANGAAAPMSLSEVRVALAAFALSPFMEKGNYPELVFRTVFEIWHTYACRERKTSSWEDADLLVDNIVGEEKMPMVSNSEATTAALFCFEAIGVRPPPDGGWVPRDGAPKQNAGEGGSAEKPDWYRNVENAEWIYHTSEDMYYHLPTSSLWERRMVESRHPEVESHTYFRVDAVHLQALSHFATSLDTGVVPLAFKAWVRYMRKKKDRHFGLPAPPASPGKSGHSKTSGSRASAAKQDAESRADTKASLPKPVQGGADNAGSADGGQATGAAAEGQAGATQAPPPAEEPPAAVKPAEEGRPADPASVDGKGAAQEPLAEKAESNGKGIFCLRCFRNSRKKARPDTSGTADPASEDAAQSLATATTVGSNAKIKQSPAVDADAKANSATDSARLNESARSAGEARAPTIDTVDRHMRKLESFLELVRKNPQRLVDHVERRRQDKTTFGFMVM